MKEIESSEISPWKGLDFRAISLDGGGIKGVFQCKFLEQLLNSCDYLRHVEAFAGTSTGSIISAALAFRITPSEILSFYTDLGKQIFNKKQNSLQRFALGNPAYKSNLLQQKLTDIFELYKLGDCSKRILISAVSLHDYSLKVFDSDDPIDSELSIVDCLMASCAAPTFFSPHKICSLDTTFIDGGIACNNPSTQIIKIALKLGVEMKRLKLLSIGTGQITVSNDPNLFMKRRPWNWALTVIDACMQTSSKINDDSSKEFMEKENYVRINPPLHQKIDLDDYDAAITHLLPLAVSEYTRAKNEIKALIGQKKTVLEVRQ